MPCGQLSPRPHESCARLPARAAANAFGRNAIAPGSLRDCLRSPLAAASKEPGMTLSRRDFLQAAAAMGAALAWSGAARGTRTAWRERRDLFPEGVASGDPAANGMILW